MEKENFFCKMLGHKFVRTVDNYLYYVNTCTRCGKTAKFYKHQDQKPVIRGPKRY